MSAPIVTGETTLRELGALLRSLRGGRTQLRSVIIDVADVPANDRALVLGGFDRTSWCAYVDGGDLAFAINAALVKAGAR